MKKASVAILLATLLVNSAWAAQSASSNTAQPTPSQISVSGKSPLFNRGSKSPDIKAIPFFAKIANLGGKLYYLGERSGLHGWVVSLNDKVQLMYSSADGSTIVIGVMITGEGKNISGPQVEILAESEKDIAALLNKTKNEKKEVIGAVNEEGGHVNDLPLSPGERLLKDFQKAAGVVIGNNESAQIYMMVKMNHPECKTAWNVLKPAIAKGDVQLKLIPVAGGLREDEVVAASLLKSANPATAWDKYVNGDKMALGGRAEEAQLTAVRDNFSLIGRWKINVLPYMVYKSKDGSIKILQGSPESVSELLSDLTN